MVMVIPTYQHVFCKKGADLELWLDPDQIFLRGGLIWVIKANESMTLLRNKT